MSNDLQNLLNALRAIAEPTRLRILALCRTGDLTVNELCQVMGQSQPRISRHLKLLVDAGVLEKMPEGASVFHRMTRNGISALVSRHISGVLPATDSTLRHDQSRLAQIRKEREDKAAEYFKINAQQWDSLRSMHTDEQEVEAMILSLLKGKDAGALLDVGTGTGRMLELLAPFAQLAEGVDKSRSMLAIARANLGKLNLENCHVRQGDMYDLPFEERSFDTILIHQVLHYVDDPELAIHETVRTLRPEGRLLIVDFAPHSIEELRRDHAHHRLGFSTDEVKGWFHSTGLKSVRTQHLKGDPLTVSLWLAEKTECTLGTQTETIASRQSQSREG